MEGCGVLTNSSSLSLGIQRDGENFSWRGWGLDKLAKSHEMGRNSHHFENDENPGRNLISTKYTEKIRSNNKFSL